VVTRLLGNRYLLALLVITALAAIFGLTSVSHPGKVAASPPTSAPARATVSSAIRACPAPGSTGATASSLALAAAAAGAGRAEVTPLSPGGAATPSPPVQVLTQPGRLALLNVPTGHPPAAALKGGVNNDAAGDASSGNSVPTAPAQGGVMIQATGALAQGFEAEQAGGGGLATAQCLAPGTDFWFVGPGQRSASSIELYLMNTDGEPADATVQIITDTGPVLGSTDAGITVPPYSQVAQSLAGVVNGSHSVALNVTTSVGRVVAAVLETSGGGPGAWLPASQPPATSQVLPGLPAAPGTGQLYVVVPGGTNAQLSVMAVTARGSYQPTGGSAISLPGGSVESVPLPSLSGTAGAIRVSANVPFTASMMEPGGASGAPGTFTAATGPVLEQGVVAGNPAASGGSSSLVLSAPGAAATVRVAELTADGAATAAPQVVTIAAGHTVVTELTGHGTQPFAVVVTPLGRSGPVYAGRVVVQNGFIRAILPMTSALSWVPLPAVSNSLTAALP
jgi:hypothetical protein